ncbi:glycosyltransferase family 4 protein [Streptomyces sp. NPDC093707]|uniref:glycosyltransferase family 4 protein n=1 Tax=Streptomyces sp. NPDC093707 TaxID=3154984 RepID=UPI00344C11D9
MKIRFLLLNAFTVGGTVRTVVNQANALAEAGHEVEIASVWRRREEPAFPIDRRIRVHTLVDASPAAPVWRKRLEALAMRSASRLVPRTEVRYSRFNRLTDRRLVKYLSTLEGGVLITTRPALNLLSAQYAPRSVVRVGQEHLHYEHHKPDLARALRAGYRQLDALAVLTEADEQSYRSVLDGSGVRIARIPNALAEARPQPSALDRPLVVAAGRLVKTKGFDHLITAFDDVVREHPDWQLRIFGAGPEKDRLRDLIHARHLYNHVYLMGPTSHLDEELAKASMFVLASRHEGFGMVLAEAMSHGVPAVSYDCPHGPREIITDGDDGLLVPPQDRPGLTAAMNRLIDDPDLRSTMGERARASSERYAMESIRPRWEALFGELLAARSDREAAGPHAA